MSEQDDLELAPLDQPAEEAAKTKEVEETVADTATEDLAKLQEQNKKLFERAKTAEAKLKEVKTNLPKTDEQQTNTDILSREEAILIAQGMQAEDLDELKAVAEAKKLSLLKAKETPLFQGYLEKIEAERKKEKAKLSASKGSASVKEEKSLVEMTREEHLAYAKEMSKNIR